MMTKSPRLTPRIARTGMLTLVASALMILLLNALLGLSEKWQQLQATEERLSAFEQRLARPLPTNRFAAYSVFLVSAPDENLASSLQNELITLVNTHAGQVVDIRELPTVTTPEGLTALRLHLVFEGDLQTVTDVLENLATMNLPVLLDNTDIHTTNPGTSPDLNLRAALDLSVWSERAA